MKPIDSKVGTEEERNEIVSYLIITQKMWNYQGNWCTNLRETIKGKQWKVCVRELFFSSSEIVEISKPSSARETPYFTCEIILT
jgi:hypothetical protein